MIGLVPRKKINLVTRKSYGFRTEKVLNSLVPYYGLYGIGSITGKIGWSEKVLNSLVPYYGGLARAKIPPQIPLNTLILKGVLGVTLDDLYKDWRVTDFGGGALYKEHVEEHFDKTLIASAESFPGDNLQQKLENYLLSIDITAAEIQKFREIMLEP